MNIRSQTMRWLALMLLLVAGVQHARAQYVYKIKADTVRIYNTCDSSAELVLQNRTRNVLGYLYNKGGGVTEFRALNPVDLIYKSNDTLYYRLSTGQIGHVKIGLSAAEQSSSFILNQNAAAQAIANAWISGYFKANTGYQSIRTTAANGTVDYSILDLASGSNRWGLGRTGLESGSNSGTDFVIKGYSDNGAEIGNYLKLTRVNKDATFGGHIKIGDSTVTTAATYFDYRSLNGTPVTSSYGVGFTTGTSGGAGMTSVSGVGPGRSLIVPFNSTAPVFTSNGGASWDTVWHAGNHAKGNQFSQVFANGAVLSTLTTNASGHVTGLGVRTLTAADIGAAPDNGSDKYIQSQTLSAQPGGFNIAGTGFVGLSAFSSSTMGAPSFSTRSIGTKTVWNPSYGATSVDYATGMETNHIWQSVPTNSDGLGFKFYGGTTMVARIGGAGGAEFAGQGRFKGWYVSGTGAAAEAGVSGGGALFVGYNRTDSSYIPVTLIGGRGAVRKRIFLDQTGYQFSDLANAGLLGTNASGYLVDKSATYVSTNGNGYIQNQNLVAQASTNFWIDGLARSQRYITYAGTAATCTMHYTMYSNGKTRWAIGMASRDSTLINGGDFRVYRFDTTGSNIGTALAIARATGVVQFEKVPLVNADPVLTAATHTGGTDVTTTISGANVPSTITRDAFGHLKTISTRTLTPADIQAAQATGSPNYIQNGTALQSSANFNISGTASAAAGFSTAMSNTGTAGVGHYILRNSANKVRWAVGTQLAESTSPANTGSDFSIFRYDDNGSLLTLVANADFNIQRSTGNIGIGTNVPTAKLDVRGTMAVTGAQTNFSANTNASSGLNISSTTGAWRLGVNNTGNGTSSNQFYLYDSTSGATRMVVERGTGNVGIGTQMPTSTLEVHGRVRADSSYGFVNITPSADVNHAGYVEFYKGDHATRIGYIGSDNTQMNYVSGTGTGNHYFAGTISSTGNITSTGTMTSQGFYQSSLRSLKKDIKPFTASATKILDSAQVRTFVYKADSANVTHIGFIADEVPDAMASPQRQGVDQANTTALLVKALQETTVRLEAMEKRVAELEKQLKEKR